MRFFRKQRISKDKLSIANENWKLPEDDLEQEEFESDPMTRLLEAQGMI